MIGSQVKGELKTFHEVMASQLGRHRNQGILFLVDLYWSVPNIVMIRFSVSPFLSVSRDPGSPSAMSILASTPLILRHKQRDETGFGEKEKVVK